MIQPMSAIKAEKQSEAALDRDGELGGPIEPP